MTTHRGRQATARRESRVTARPDRPATPTPTRAVRAAIQTDDRRGTPGTSDLRGRPSVPRPDADTALKEASRIEGRPGGTGLGRPVGRKTALARGENAPARRETAPAGLEDDTAVPRSPDPVHANRETEKPLVDPSPGDPDRPAKPVVVRPRALDRRSKGVLRTTENLRASGGTDASSPSGPTDRSPRRNAGRRTNGPSEPSPSKSRPNPNRRTSEPRRTNETGPKPKESGRNRRSTAESATRTGSASGAGQASASGPGAGTNDG